MKQTFFKVVAWLIFIGAILLSVAFLVGACAGFIFVPDAKFTKLILLAVALVVAAIITFVVGLGIFEFIRKELVVEKEVEEIVEKSNLKDQISK
jgi:hypothetical protein